MNKSRSMAGGTLLIFAMFLGLILISETARCAAAQTSASPSLERTVKAVNFRNDMRHLWEDHVIWTRMVIVDVAANQPDLNTAVDRLMRNQVDIGNAIKPYYGTAAGNKLTSLLRTHIQISYELLTATKAGDTAKTQDAKTRWYANGDQIAVFLNSANPKYWPLNTVKSLMRTHLDTTLDEATARLQGDWAKDVAAFDKVQHHILVMSDAISLGIIRQFPAKFKDSK